MTERDPVAGVRVDDPPTDEQVEAAAKALMGSTGTGDEWQWWAADARAALTAALRVPDERKD